MKNRRISLLSPEYLLSFERRPFHAVPPGSLCSSFLPVRIVVLSVKRPYAITLCDRLPIGLRACPLKPPLLFEATTPVKLPTSSVLAPRVRDQMRKVRISTSTPRGLAPPPRCLRTYLHTSRTRSQCCKMQKVHGSFRPVAGNRIFTDTTISPSLTVETVSRSPYTIRAGRNLPDKEFRYLRTVIVTAAVYRGFNSKLLLR